ncbi:hypothetical protein SAMN05216350_10167 [Polaromonas sp. YR568]|uniref:hypothetical protein n=1 Tax=Polaromonas sp. YR568 TaxID=1855301 RepID=UPI0008E1C189|nr:hypothetical protein [Polaromonas sp. YR568]SFU28247.1 hypothetical protein SAMN05216350_10167 [Polaromonas sp. YR568]
MIVNPSVVVDELIQRITSIVLRTYEVEQLLPEGNSESLSLASHELVSAVATDTGQIDFSCELLLKAEERRSSFLVKVQGQAAYETPVWRINEIYDVVVDPLDRGDSGFAGLA